MPIKRHRWTSTSRMMRQLNEWCTRHRKLPPPGTIRCGDCGGGMEVHWRTRGHMLVLICLHCQLEFDAPRGTDWMVRMPEPA
jgi:hypothetical protein